MNLTPTEQQAVKEALEKLLPKGRVKAHDFGWKTGFEDGIEWALRVLFEPRCVAFAEWVQARYCLTRTEKGIWYEMGKIEKGLYTTKELYTIYQEQLNKQQDGQ